MIYCNLRHGNLKLVASQCTADALDQMFFNFVFPIRWIQWNVSEHYEQWSK